MKHAKIALILLLVVTTARSQSKIYVSASKLDITAFGANVLFGTDYELFKFRYYNFDVEYQQRIWGSFNAVTGVCFFNAGYNVKEIGFSSRSEFKANYLAIPLMARWNPGNRSFYYLDFGVVPFYLLNAHLSESVNKFGGVYTVSGDITEYSNRFYFGYKFQMLVPINRFYIGFYVFAPFKGQTSLKGLENNWGLNAQESTYLLSEGFRDFTGMGLKVGVRIR